MRSLPIVLAGLLVGLASPLSRAGVIEGRVLGPGGQPLVGVDLDVFDQSTGKKLNTPNDNSQTGGNFSVIVPAGLYRVGFDPVDVPGGTLAPAQVLNVLVTTSADLGDVFLEAGVLVSGRIVGPGGASVVDADLDFVDTATDETAFTPGDNTDATGAFSVVVSPATYAIQLEPQLDSGLVAAQVGPFVIGANTALGTFALGPGVVLRGTVTDLGGGPIAGIDADARDAITRQAIPLVDSITAADGTYAVVVPPGTIDVAFEPAAGLPFLASGVDGLLVTAETELDVVLPLSSTDPLPSPIALRDAFQGSLSVGTEVDEADVIAIAGVVLSLTLTFQPKAALVGVSLTAPSGATVPLADARKEKPGKVLVKSVPLPETGSYALRLYSRAGKTADYTLRVNGKVPKALRKLAGTGAVQDVDEVVEVTVLAFAGSLLGATVKAAGSVLQPTIVELLSPTGSAVPLGDALQLAPGKASLKQQPLEETGAYTLRLGGLDGTIGELSWSVKIRPPAFPKTVVDET